MGEIGPVVNKLSFRCTACQSTLFVFCLIKPHFSLPCWNLQLKKGCFHRECYTPVWLDQRLEKRHLRLVRLRARRWLVGARDWFARGAAIGPPSVKHSLRTQPRGPRRKIVEIGAADDPWHSKTSKRALCKRNWTEPSSWSSLPPYCLLLLCSGPSPAGGQWCPGPPFHVWPSGCCIHPILYLKMCPPPLWCLASLLRNPGDGPDCVVRDRSRMLPSYCFFEINQVFCFAELILSSF